MIWEWLASTKELQEKTYGYDLEGLQQAEKDGDAGPLAEYIHRWVFAAFIELAEASVEYSWKPWVVDEPFVNRRRVLDETVDVMHFIGNILVGMGVSDREFWSAYRAKQAKNRQRQASGVYSAKKGGLAEGSDV